MNEKAIENKILKNIILIFKIFFGGWGDFY